MSDEEFKALGKHRIQVSKSVKDRRSTSQNASLNVTYWDFVFCQPQNKAIGAQWFKKTSLSL